MRSTLFALAAAISAVSAPAQGAATIYGTPCTTIEGTPTIGHTGVPTLGSSFEVDYAGPNYFTLMGYSRPWLALGFSWFGPPVTIPPVTPHQPASCHVYASHDILIPMPAQPILAQYEESFPIVVPNQPALVGAVFVAQWFVQHHQTCATLPCPDPVRWIASSDAILFGIG